MIPCPICCGNHSCSATDDGLHFCWREHADVPGWVFLGACRNGFGMFRDTGRCGSGAACAGNGHGSGHGHGDGSRNGTAGTNGRAAHPTPTPPALSSAELTAYLRAHACHVRERRMLADILGVHPRALERLRLGYVPETENEPEHFLFPERDGAGNVVGLLRRYMTGVKRQLPGSARGLLYDPDTDDLGAVVLIVEGPSDVAAALTIGLAAVGRPNNLGGAEHLVPLLGRHAAAGLRVIVLGENDRKPDGHWPGREGAEAVAQQLADAWGLPVDWALPPEGIKDLREWVWRNRPDINDHPTCERLAEEVRKRICEGSMKKCPRLHHRYNTYSIDGVGTEVPLRESGTSAPGELTDVDRLGPSVRRVFQEGLTRAPCPRHFTPLLQHRVNAHHGLALRVDCWTAGCAVCGRRYRSRWLIHLMCLFDQAGELFVWQGEAGKDYATFRKAASRHGANYVALRLANGTILVVTDHALPKVLPIDAAAAAESTAAGLLNLAPVRKPVSTSKAWALSRLREESGQYLRRGAAPRGGFGLVVHRLRRKQMEPATTETQRGARCNWVFPGDWPEERIAWYYEVLSAPADPSEADYQQEHTTS
jgi:hypothetical protein